MRELLFCMLCLGAVSGCADDRPTFVKRSGDAIMLSDNTRLSRGASTWMAAAPGVTANVIQAHEDTAAFFEDLGGGVLIYEGVTTWRSNEGVPSLTLRSARQTAVAQFDGTRYALSGLVGGAAYDPMDMLTVETSDGDGEPVSVSVAAPPPPADPTTLLGEPQGLATEVRIADGTFDLMYVFVAAASGGPGDSGLMRFVDAEAMTLDGPDRVAPLLDDASIAALEARSLSPLAIYVAYFYEDESTVFFEGRAVQVQAGRMFQIAPADLSTGP
jgi:hypothetical protein